MGCLGPASATPSPRTQGLAAPHTSLILSSNCSQSLVTPWAGPGRPEPSRPHSKSAISV